MDAIRAHAGKPMLEKSAVLAFYPYLRVRGQTRSERDQIDPFQAPPTRSRANLSKPVIAEAVAPTRPLAGMLFDNIKDSLKDDADLRLHSLTHTHVLRRKPHGRVCDGYRNYIV